MEQHSLILHLLVICSHLLKWILFKIWEDGLLSLRGTLWSFIHRHYWHISYIGLTIGLIIKNCSTSCHCDDVLNGDSGNFLCKAISVTQVKITLCKQNFIFVGSAYKLVKLYSFESVKLAISFHVLLLLSMVVLNSRNQPKNMWLQKECTYINIGIKIRIRKTYLNTISTALTMLYLHSNKPNAVTLVH